MADRGTKRRCASCGISYYDLNRTPVTCPKCDAPYVPVAPVRAPRKMAAVPIAAPLEEPAEEAEEEAGATEEDFEEAEDLPADEETFVAPGDEEEEGD